MLANNGTSKVYDPLLHTTKPACTLHLYSTLQGELPSTLLNLAVVKGEVRVVPVAKEEDCQEEGFRFWENPILLKQGDAGYSITIGDMQQH